MRNVITVEVRRFPLTLVKFDNQEPYVRHIAITKEQLRAAQTCGASSKELITRICEKQGYKVLEIGKPKKRSISIDVNELWNSLDFLRECESGGI